MDRRHLTDDLVESLAFAPNADDRYEIYDASVENLLVRVGSKKKSFSVNARFSGPGGRTSRRLLGRFPRMTVEAARVAAHDWNNKVKSGVDPAIELETERHAEVLRLRSTFASVMSDYLAQLPNRERNLSVKNDIDLLKRYFLDPKQNPWLNKPISMVTDEDVAKILEDVNTRTPTTAYACYSKIRTFFRWAMKPTIRNKIGLKYNPICDMVAKDLGLHRQERSKVFEYEEARAYLLAASAMNYPYGPCLRVLIETGQRIGVVSGMRWSQISLERKLWIIPGTKNKSASRGRTSKTDAAHKVPLSARVIQILLLIKESLPVDHGDFVFSFTNGQTCVGSFSNLRRLNANEVLESETGRARGRFERLMRKFLDDFGFPYEPWVWHDVRRTVRTHLEPITGKEAAEAAIGHGQTGIARVYNLHKYRAQIRRAFTIWSNLLEKVENGTCTIADWEHDPEAFREPTT